jgi:hypothetical protein
MTEPAGDGSAPTYAMGLADSSYAWYHAAAIRARRGYKVSECSLLVVTALIPVTGLLWREDALVPAALGSVAVIIAGLRAIFHWQENYLRFSRAREAVEAERRLYITRSRPYEHDATRERRLASAVSRVEQEEMDGWVHIARNQPGSVPSSEVGEWS